MFPLKSPFVRATFDWRVLSTLTMHSSFVKGRCISRAANCSTSDCTPGLRRCCEQTQMMRQSHGPLNQIGSGLAQSEMEKHGHRFDLGLRTSSRLNCIDPQSCWLKQTFLKIISIHVQTINLYVCLWIKSSFLLLSPKFVAWKDIFFLNTFLF